jgi:hypothetical protein
LTIIDEIMVSRNIIDKINEFSSGFAGTGGPPSTDYLDLAESMAETLYNGYNTT